MSIRDLKEEREKIHQQMRAMLDEPGAEAEAVEQSHKWKSLRGQNETVEERIKRQEYFDEVERRMNGENITGNGDRHLDRELRNYSLLRAIAGQFHGVAVDDGFEREIDTELKKKSDRQFKGRAVPMSIFTHSPVEQRVTTTVAPAGGPGGNLISTDYRGDQFIDLLRPNSVVYRMGATLLTGLVGNVAIPRLKVDTTFAMVAENAGLTASDPQVEQVLFSPKTGGIVTEFSRSMTLQAGNPSVEQFARRDFAANIATGVDKIAIVGGGTNEPNGILTTTGIGDVPGGAAGLAPSWANVLSLIETVGNANGSLNAGFLTTHKAVRKMRSTVKVATTDSAMIQEDPRSLAGYPLTASSNVPSNLVKGGSGAVCSALIFGNISEVVMAFWSELDVLVNEYDTQAYLKGNVLIRGLVTFDVNVRHPASFAATKDVLTT